MPLLLTPAFFCSCRTLSPVLAAALCCTAFCHASLINLQVVEKHTLYFKKHAGKKKHVGQVQAHVKKKIQKVVYIIEYIYNVFIL
jgi:hypothetical protein